MDLTLFFVDSLRKLLNTKIGDITFLRDMTQLRQVLCCSACGNLLSENPLHVADKCNHFICRSCLRRRDREIFCEECCDWERFASDPTLSCFVATYKAFCEFILRSPDMVHLNPDSPLFEIVKEGSLRDEEFVFQKSFNGVSNNDNLNQEDSDEEDEPGNDLMSNSIWIKSEEGTSSFNTSKSHDPETERTEFRYQKQTWSESSAQTVELLASGSSSNESSSHKLSIVGSVVRTDETTGPVKKLKVRLPKPKTPPKIRRGCRCGNAATVPGKLTCCGQRCPCYVLRRACHECRCKGCRNPHLPGGKKFIQGINVIDTKSNLAVPSSSSVSPTHLFSSSGGSNFTSIYPVGSFASLPIISVSHSQQLSDQKSLF